MRRKSLLNLLLLVCALVTGAGTAWANPGDEIKSPDGVVNGKSYYIKGVYTYSGTEITMYYGPTETDAPNTKVQSGAVTDMTNAMPVKFVQVEGGWTLQTPNGNYIRPHTSNGQTYFVADPVVLQLTSGTTKEGEDMGISIGAYSDYYIQANKTNPKIGAYKATQWDVTLIEASDAVSSAVAFANPTPSIEFPATSTYDQAATTAEGYTGTVSYEITSNTAGATLSGTTVTVSQAGSVTVKATAPAVEGFLASTATYTLTVTDNRAECGLEYSTTIQSVVVGTVLPAPELTNPNNLAVSFSSEDLSIATVDNEGNVTGVAVGTTTIVASFAGNEEFAAGSASYTLTVKKPMPEGALFYEGMTGYTGSSDVGSELSTTYANLDSEDWASFSKVYAGKVISGDADGHLKFGSGSAVGKAVTNAIALNGTGKLTYKVQRYSCTEPGNLIITVTGATATGDVDVTGTASWEEKTVLLTGATGEVVITFETTVDNKRIRVDDILVVAAPAAVTATVTAEGMATYVADYNLDFSAVEGLAAYKAKVEGNSITFTKVTAVPAGEGVLLRALTTLTEDTQFEVPVIAEAAELTDNDFLPGTGAALASSEEIDGVTYYNYILSKKSGSDDLGFYKANGNMVAKNRAYLRTTTAPAEGARLTIRFNDEVTGIAENEMLTNVDNENIYNLSGQRISKPMKGLFIQNGKKVIK